MRLIELVMTVSSSFSSRFDFSAVWIERSVESSNRLVCL